MFDEFMKNCPPMYAEKPSAKHVGKNIAAVLSLIEKEDAMAKRRLKTKRLIVTAAITVFTLLSLFTVVNAATDGNIIKFIMGGREIGGEFNDYVDSKGYRHISFKAVLPIYEESYAIIFDADAPWGENVRVITYDTDPDFMDKLRRYKDARESSDWWEADPEDFGLVLKDSELCDYHFGVISETEFKGHNGILGGEFMHTGAAAGKPSGVGEDDNKDDPDGIYYDWENEIKTVKRSIYYYVGKE